MQWVKLGDFIEQCTETNDNLFYDEDVAVGVNIDKELRKTKANTESSALKMFLLLNPGCFAYNPRGSRKLGLGFNDTQQTLITTYNFFVFKIKDECLNKLLPEYLFMYLCRKEWDRHAEYLSWGSSTEYFKFETLLEVKLPLPSIDEQKQVVAAWRGLKNLGEQNEHMAGPLMDLCQSYLQDLKHKYPLVEIGPYIHKGNKNTDNTIDNVLGVGQSGFIKPQKKPNESLKNYKIITYNDICYAPPLYNILSDALHLYKCKNPAVCSPIYEVFAVQEDIILPEYLLLWLKRSEFKRYAEFYSMGVRNTFDYSLMEQVKIPLPPIEIQRAIVEIYNCAKTSKYISETAKKLNSDICPALMRQIIGDNQ
ncbi:MAG: restriction endonuclease subunit S [Alphaproteobacteria bacterium]|nr:restriction endonuclease subunit S [Alphaproteobacteria bacterium]